MTERADRPRVLLVSSSAFNSRSGGGITLTNLFKGWPVDRLAAAHAEVLPVDPGACARYYRLGPDELGAPGPLRGLMRSPAPPASHGTAPARSGALHRLMRRAFNRVFSEGGLRDRASLSPALREFVEDFRPELIYSLLGSLGFVRLVRQVGAATGAPVALHMMDDWPSTRYRGALLSPIFQARMEAELGPLVAQAAVRMGISEPMCREFERRYGHPFAAYHNVLDLALWEPFVRREWKARPKARVVYSGSILPAAQLDSLRDVARAVSTLRASGEAVEMTIHATLGPDDPYRGLLEDPPAVRLAPPPGPDDVARLLSGADVLVLPVNFDRRSAAYVRYSFPTKLPAYLLSGTPILAYGPPDVAQIQTARAGGWSLVVDRRDDDALRRALVTLWRDEGLRERLGRRAQEAARREHAADRVRPAFQEALSAACRRSSPTGEVLS